MTPPDMAKLQANDAEAWDRAYQLLWPIAWSAASRRLSHFAPETVEDVAVEAIGAAAESLAAGQVSCFDHLKAFVAVIANRKAIDVVRRLRARGEGAPRPGLAPEAPSSLGPNPLEQLMASEAARVLLEFMRGRRAQEYDLLHAYLIEGLKQRELAERFGLPIGTVGARLSRVLEEIRAELDRHPALKQELLEAMR